LYIFPSLRFPVSAKVNGKNHGQNKTTKTKQQGVIKYTYLDVYKNV